MYKPSVLISFKDHTSDIKHIFFQMLFAKSQQDYIRSGLLTFQSKQDSYVGSQFSDGLKYHTYQTKQGPSSQHYCLI